MADFPSEGISVHGRRVSLIWQHDPTVDAPAKYRRACSYEAYIPNQLAELTFTLDSQIAGVVSETESAIHDLNAVAQPGLAPLARLLLRTESIASSKIEGLQVGARQLAYAEARSETGRKLSGTTKEIMANIDAMQQAIDDAVTVEHFSVDQIRAVHRRLMAGAPNRIAGELRKQQNWIGGNDYNPCGADFVPPPPEYIDTLLSDLCDAINSEVLSPIVQAALIHAQFETIHPFDDGNGRTGRALVQMVLKRRGLAPNYVPPVSVVLSASRNRYIDGLNKFRNGHVEEWVEHFAAAAARAARLARSYLHAVEALSSQWRAQLSAAAAPRSDAAAWAVIHSLPAHPIITAPVAAAATGRTKVAIYRALKELEEAGVLSPLSASVRNQSWEAVGLLDLLEGLDAGEPLAP